MGKLHHLLKYLKASSRLSCTIIFMIMCHSSMLWWPSSLQSLVFGVFIDALWFLNFCHALFQTLYDHLCDLSGPRLPFHIFCFYSVFKSFPYRCINPCAIYCPHVLLVNKLWFLWEVLKSTWNLCLVICQHPRGEGQVDRGHQWGCSQSEACSSRQVAVPQSQI